MLFFFEYSRCHADVTELDDGRRRSGRGRECLEVDMANGVSIRVCDLNVAHGRDLDISVCKQHNDMSMPCECAGTRP
jgi:hypothetical protein